MANTLWYKYHAYEQWGLLAWVNIVAAATDAASIKERYTEQGLDEDAYSHLLFEVHERLGDGLGPAIVQWLKLNVSAPSNQPALSSPSALVRLLAFAVMHDVLPISVVLRDFVCPMLAMINRCPSPGTLCHHIIWMLFVLLVPQNADAQICRVGPAAAEHLHARRSLAFSMDLFPCIVQLTALLVKYENTVVDRAEPEKLQQEFGNLRRAIWKDPVYTEAFFREPQQSMRAFLDFEADDAIKGCLLDALVEAMGEAGARENLAYFLFCQAKLT
jgi:hypothetical protein